MKKLIAVFCALLVACLSAAAFAEVPVSNLYRPKTPEAFRTLVGGKSFEARITGWGSYGEDEDAKFELSLTVCERDRFDAAAIESLKPQDILSFGDGTATMAMEVTPDETGFTVKGAYGETYSFTKTEAGDYLAAAENGLPFYTDIFTVTVPFDKDIVFLDWSDPDNTKEPVKRSFDDLLPLIQDGANFSAYNTKVTFDETGKLTELLYTYSPFN